MSKIRPLTTIERSYIQTFPSSFVFNGTKTHLEQMIGNAVPVNLGECVAETITAYVKNGVVKQSELFGFEESFLLPNQALHRVC